MMGLKNKKVILLLFSFIVFSLQSLYANSSAPESSIQLTLKEKEWLAKHPEIVFGIDESWEPYVIKNNDGSYSGIDPEIIDILNKKTGLNIKLKTAKWSNLLDELKEKKIDGVSSSTVHKKRVSFVNFSDPYSSTGKLLYVRKNELSKFNTIDDFFNKNIAIQKGNVLEEGLAKKIKGSKIKSFINLEDSVNALLLGKVDGLIVSDMVNYKFLGRGMLSIAPAMTIGDSIELVFSVRKDWPELISIINKGLALIPVDKFISIRAKYLGTSLKKDDGKNLFLTKEELDFIKKNPVVRVANAMDWPPFDYNEFGKVKGLSVDYINLLSEKVGLKIEFVSGYSWKKLQEMLKEKKLDILPALYINEERKKYMNFTKPYSKGRLGVFINNDGVNIENITDIIGKRVGMQKGHGSMPLIKKSFPGIEFIEYDVSIDLVKELAVKKLDAIIGNPWLFYYYAKDLQIKNMALADYIELQKEDKQNTLLHMGIRKDWPLLRSILDKSMDSLSSNEILDLESKWLPRIEPNKKENTLTKDEKKFIKDHPVISFMTRAHRPPFAYSEDGKAKGISIDYMNLIAKKVGFIPRYILDESITPQKAFNELQKKERVFDTLMYSVKTPSREKDLFFGDPYISNPLMIITNKKTLYVKDLKELKGKTIVIEKGFKSNEWIKRDYPEIKIINTKNTIEALEMVNENKADAYIGFPAVVNFMIMKHGFDNLIVSASSGYKDVKYRFVAPKEWPELISVLNKTYRSITPSEHQSIYQKWYTVQIVDRIDYKIIWQIVIVSLLIFIAILFWVRKLKNEIALRKEAQQRLKEQEEMIIAQSRQAAMGEMISMIAHQWRQPITAIGMTVNNLKADIDLDTFNEKNCKSYCKDIDQMVNYLSTTIDDFRNFFKKNKEPQKIVVNSAIEGALKIIGKSLENNNILLQSEFKSDSMILTFPNELIQVFLNIIGNARDVIKSKGIEKGIIKIDSYDKDGRTFVVIRDNGGGVPEDIVNKIFEPYFTTKGVTSGTGLGLYMSKIIIEKHLYGKIEVVNDKTGASFIISIPSKAL